MIYNRLPPGHPGPLIVFVDCSQIPRTSFNWNVWNMPPLRVRCADPNAAETQGQGPKPPDSLLRPASHWLGWQMVSKQMHTEGRGILSLASQHTYAFRRYVFSFSGPRVLVSFCAKPQLQPYLPLVQAVFIPDIFEYYRAAFRPGGILANATYEPFRSHLPNVRRVYIAPSRYTLYDRAYTGSDYFLNWPGCILFFGLGWHTAPPQRLEICFVDPFFDPNWATMQPDLVSDRPGMWRMPPESKKRLKRLRTFNELPDRFLQLFQ